MTRRKWVGLLAVPLGALLLACNQKQVQTVSNVQRTTAVWPAGTTATGGPHICVEYATPAEKLKDREASLSVPISGEQSAELRYQQAESLASIYSVSEIMQFGHAALYRLCEASGNQAIDEGTYKDLFKQTLTDVNHLLELQMTAQGMAAEQRLATHVKDLAELDEQWCAESRKDSSTAALERERLRKRRKQIIESIEAVEAKANIKLDVDRSRIPPTFVAWATHDEYVKALTTCSATSKTPAACTVPILDTKGIPVVPAATEAACPAVTRLTTKGPFCLDKLSALEEGYCP